MTSAAYARAEEAWLNPRENSRLKDDWLDAQDEKKEILAEASRKLDGWYEPVTSLDDLDDTLKYLEKDLASLKELRDRLAELEDEHPAEYDPGEWEE